MNFQQIIMIIIITGYIKLLKKTKYLYNRIFTGKKLSNFNEISAKLISHSFIMLKIH